MRTLDTKILGTILGVTLRNTSIRERCGIADVIKFEKTRTKEWNQHINIMCPSMLAKACRDGQPQRGKKTNRETTKKIGKKLAIIVCGYIAKTNRRAYPSQKNKENVTQIAYCRMFRPNVYCSCLSYSPKPMFCVQTSAVSTNKQKVIENRAHCVFFNQYI